MQLMQLAQVEQLHISDDEFLLLARTDHDYFCGIMMITEICMRSWEAFAQNAWLCIRNSRQAMAWQLAPVAMNLPETLAWYIYVCCFAATRGLRRLNG